jgi:hypothetical protein
MAELQLVQGKLLDPESLQGLLAQLLPQKLEGKPIDTIRFTPQPKQEFLLDKVGLLNWYLGKGEITAPICRLIGYGGAAFGAKTYGILGVAAVAAYAFPGVQIAFFRRTYSQIDGAGGAMQKAYEIFGKTARDRDGGRNFYWENGSQFFFQHCENERDVYSYDGKEFDILLIDEATHFTWFMVDYLLARNRPSGSHGMIKPFAILPTNPGNIGHSWYMQLFHLGNKDFWKYRDTTTIVNNPNPGADPIEVYFIPAYMSDNPIGMKRDPDYEKNLKQRDPDLADALIHGDWNVFSGQAFRDFDYNIHTCDPFEIPAYFPKWRAVDWGSAEPFCCLWFARDPDIGRIYVYREVYLAGMTDSQQAQMIAVNSPDTENISITFADPKSFWVAKNRYGITYTSADEYMDNGILLWEADNDRINGKKKIDQLLSLLPDGKPGLVIFRNAVNLIRTLPKLARSTANPEDVADRQEDHAYDTLRYGLTNPLMFTKSKQNKKKKANTENPWNSISGI